MGKKSAPEMPAAPDPVAVAQAQAGVNKDAAITQANLNRINQYTPQGSITYQQIGTNADGTPQYQQTQTLSADEQAKYDQTNKVALALNGLAINNIDRVGQTQSQAFSYDGMTPMVTSVGQNLPGLNYGSGAARPVQSGIAPTGNVTDLSPGFGGNVQTSLNYSGLTPLPGTNDFSADARRVADSVYSQAASRLDPQFSQADSDFRARMAAQGISENSDAYRRELDNMGRTKNDAYNQAVYSAQQAGGAEQSRLFGLAMNARQQGQNEVNAQGAFANTAQNQNFTQGAQTAQFNNQAQDQRYQQALAIADLFNQSQQQQFTQEQAAAALNNSTRAQAYNEQAGNATLNNQARQQQIAEATYLRNLPLNEIAALLGTGSPVAQPNFQPVSQVGVAAPDYQGTVNSNYNAAMSNYQQQMAARSSMLGSIFGLAGTGASLALSDRRFKRNVQRVGVLANGLATYTYQYVGSRLQQFGVMAQEALRVVPEAVGRLSNGVLYVNYAKVF